jgi:thiamine kinase-like enzyme
VSPVRYVRDGLVENNRSKGILLNSVHTLIEQHTHCFYFPAYEIVVDQLRDYRFYKEDLVHPNHLAVNYVWEKFAETCCTEATKNFLKEYEPLLRGLQHRPIHHNQEAHEKFRLELAEKIKALDEKFL